MSGAAPVRRSRGWPVIAGVGFILAFIPALVCLLRGAMTSSLWLDEVLYYYFESDLPLRASNLGIPRSRLAAFFGGYFFCDVQRLVHHLLSGVGVTIHNHPELFLRALPFACFLFATGLFLFATRRGAVAVLDALLFSASPLMLYYAFEGRVFLFSSLAVVCFCVLTDRAFESGSLRTSAWAAAAGILATHSEQWTACFLAAMVGYVAVGSLRSRALAARLSVIASAALPGLLLAVFEAGIFIFRGSPSRARFPPYERWNFWVALQKTMAGPFGFWKCGGRLLADIGWLPSIPETGFVVLLILLVRWTWRRRGSPGVAVVLGTAAIYLAVPQFFGWRSLPGHDVDLFSFPVAVLLSAIGYGLFAGDTVDRFFLASAVLGIVLSITLGVTVGFLIIPRYQVPLWPAVFYGIARLRIPVARAFTMTLVAIDLLLLPCTVVAIKGKSESKAIAELIWRAPGDGPASIVVQHAVRIRYPDPVVSFPLDFYLNVVPNGGQRISIYELPDLREITGQRSSSRYLGTGRGLAKYYLTTPTELWEAWVAHQSLRRIWFVSPNPRSFPEEKQRKRFLDALTTRFRREGSPVSFPQDRGSLVELYRPIE